jgi:2-polyprenyl-6-methoxyphenol hydroxylase-like FAD-dependent oxidoreductase
MRILRSLLHEKIIGKVTEAGVAIHMGKRLVAIDETQDSVKVTFADGTVDTCDILVGADGIHSVVRTMHVQPSLEPTYTGLSSLYSLVPATNLQSPLYFKGNFGAIMLSNGLFATVFYDKARQHMYWFNTHEIAAKDRDGWTAYGKESDIIKEQVHERTKNIKIPLVKEIIDISPNIKFYPVYTLPSGGKWYTERTILIGDAAHGSPLSI